MTFEEIVLLAKEKSKGKKWRIAAPGNDDLTPGMIYCENGEPRCILGVLMQELEDKDRPYVRYSFPDSESAAIRLGIDQDLALRVIQANDGAVLSPDREFVVNTLMPFPDEPTEENVGDGV